MTELAQKDNAASPDALIETLIANAAQLNHPIPVIDSDNRLLGTVDHRAILLAIEGS